ncbi:MAG: SAM-dependent chlorinase/fluorinase [Anaerolineales bacterium]|nr:SAM-dependent chlorinase/fluorinase [Anaerolineales bacterium]
MAIISLTTDFGIKDGFVGTMKGVILGICPTARIVDISHHVPAQNILSAAFTLLGSTIYFPAGTVHVIVVDPGVGTARRAIAARIGTQTYVAPDNGVLTLIYERAERGGQHIAVVDLNKPQYHLSEVSTTFHGRDIFSPCGAHLASGVLLHEIGTRISDAVRIPIPRPVWHGDVLSGEIIQIDHFGNMASNIGMADLGNLLDKPHEICINIGAVDIHGLVNTFGEKMPGELTALINSEGHLEISLVNGNAAEKLNGKMGDSIDVRLA